MQTDLIGTRVTRLSDPGEKGVVRGVLHEAAQPGYAGALRLIVEVKDGRLALWPIERVAVEKKEEQGRGEK